MKYNDIISYNEPNINYVGTLVINVPGIINPIVVHNVNIAIGVIEDFSNLTTIGVVSYDLAPTGIITIEASAEQAYALAEAKSIIISPVANTSSTIENTDPHALVENSSTQTYAFGEITIIPVD